MHVDPDGLLSQQFVLGQRIPFPDWVHGRSERLQLPNENVGSGSETASRVGVKSSARRYSRYARLRPEATGRDRQEEKGSAQMAFPTTEARLEAAERELGARLPNVYRMRLIARNGGELSTDDDDWQVFPVFDPTDRRTLSRSANHIVLETRNARTWQGFPAEAVAIASNGAGDFLVLLPARTSGLLDPQVHVWNHETGQCQPVALRYED